MYFFRLENVLETTSHCIYSFSSSLIFVKTTCLSEVCGIDSYGAISLI